MAISEARRFELHGKLRDVLGDEMGTTLMEHLPPSGWTNVARQDEMERRFDSLESRFVLIEKRLDGMDRRFDQLDSRIRTFSTIGLTVILALAAIQVQILLTM
jgi:hypothetical protein